MPAIRSPYDVKMHCRLQRVQTAVHINQTYLHAFCHWLSITFTNKVQSADKTVKKHLNS